MREDGSMTGKGLDAYNQVTSTGKKWQVVTECGEHIKQRYSGGLFFFEKWANEKIINLKCTGYSNIFFTQQVLEEN